MQRRALIAATCAAILGVALLMVYKKRFEAETSGGPKVLVLVANQDIAFGTTLQKEMLAPRGVPVAYLEDRHIRLSDLRRVVGVRISRSVRANESLLWSDLAVTTDAGRTLADMVQPGQRALAVPATLPSTFSGLLRPGDRVDALLTTADKDRDNRITVPVLQNLLVLAVGSDVGVQYGAPVEEEPRSFRTRMTTVTLAVGPRQAELLTLAQDQGTLSLTLRHPNDVEVIDGLPEARRADLVVQSRREELQRQRRRIRARKPESTEEPSLERID